MGEDLPEGITREFLRDRVELFRPDTVLYRESPFFNSSTVEIMIGRVRELTADLDRFDLVVDLPEETKRPDPDTRDMVVSLINEDDKLRKIYIVVGASPVLRIGLKFILAGITGKEISVLGTFEDLEREIDGGQD
jgi:hypothetical protein